MRAAPAVTVILGRPRLAIAALAGLAAAAIAVSAAWARARSDAWGGALLLLVCLHAAWLARAVARRDPLRLRWDGQRWWLGPAAGDDAQPGTVAVAMDLGAWLLLRFQSEAAARAGVRWLPAERAALPADWHGLRCALYSPRPAAPADASSAS